MPEPERIGDYDIESEIGAGGMARVFRARHPLLGTRHAIKVLDPMWRADAAARARFLDEARIQASHLDHPNVVKVTGIIATPEHAALVMELLDGGSLEARIPAIRDQPDEIRRVMYAVLDAVGKAHEAGIIHRDLKPANVLLTADGTPKVTDFGIAKVIAPDDATKKATAVDARMGTLAYMSPEQIRRAKDVTARSDIFALGAMLYEMATGTMPFPGESDYDVMDAIINGRYTPPRTAFPACDPVIAQVIATALQPDPALRYGTCADMAAALRAEPPKQVDEPKLRGTRSAATAEVPPPARRDSVPVLIAAIGGAVLLVVGLAYWRKSSAGAPPPDAMTVAAADASAGGSVDAAIAGTTDAPIARSIDATDTPAGRGDAGDIVFCVSGFRPDRGSYCEIDDRPGHPTWRLHGYLEDKGACFECWDENDGDCETKAPAITGFRFVGKTCGDLPPGLPGFSRVHAFRASTTRTTTTSSSTGGSDAPPPPPTPPGPPSAPAAPRPDPMPW